MDSRPPNIALYEALVKIDKFDHDFYTFFALILHDLALSGLACFYYEKFAESLFYHYVRISIICTYFIWFTVY